MDAARLTRRQIEQLQHNVDKDWQVVGDHHLQRTFLFQNFREALTFVNSVGDLAEAMDHHPDVYLAWGKVTITIWTHSADGLTRKDFHLAAKIDSVAGGKLP